ncbi:MAG TPA: carboxypeptidase regulatory-like domain-containing protein [Chitinispirillaceae bacterium]|nr:carboxypeptidase regulatory-like domain-containing protein [Chitinispirillaceae bacterium]
MNLKLIMAMIAAVCLDVFSQSVTITGKVTNSSGSGISGALVKLASKNLSATTDASGAYSIKGATAVNAAIGNAGYRAILLKNGVVTVNLKQPERVQIELFDMQGNILNNIINTPPSAGNYRFDLNNRGLAAAMVLVRVTIGQHTTSFRCIPSCRGGSIAETIHESVGNRMEKTGAAVDSLLASAAGYTAKTVKITSYTATVDFTLEIVSCKATASKSANTSVTGSGPHKVVVETNPDPGIKCGTIYRPEDLGPGKNYPIFVWGEGGCSQDGFSNKAAMGEFASWGYFIVADGTPNSTGACQSSQDGKAFIEYVKWAIEQNENPCSAYYQSLDTTKIAADGFSCGGLMAENASYYPKFTAIGITSSGLFNKDDNIYSKIHTPFKIMNGGSGDMAYENGLRDYNEISAIGKPIIYFSKTSGGHGTGLESPKGEYNTVNLAWLNWHLKGDTTATGKALLMGPNCKFCKNSGWVFKSANWQ